METVSAPAGDTSVEVRKLAMRGRACMNVAMESSLAASGSTSEPQQPLS
jgi:hypothetical protein